MSTVRTPICPSQFPAGLYPLLQALPSLVASSLTPSCFPASLSQPPLSTASQLGVSAMSVSCLLLGLPKLSASPSSKLCGPVSMVIGSHHVQLHPGTCVFPPHPSPGLILLCLKFAPGVVLSPVKFSAKGYVNRLSMYTVGDTRIR